MTAELDNTSENQDVTIVDKVESKPLMLFKTDIDRYGRDIPTIVWMIINKTKGE